MGDPSKIRKTYETPKHPWNKTRIDAEKAFKKEFGFKRKKEIYKMESLLKSYKDRAKALITQEGTHADLLRNQLKTKLVKLGLLSQDSSLSGVLAINSHDLMQRRLQTVLVNKNLARSPEQARQFIVHRHVQIGNKLITRPGYLVPLEEESQLQFRSRSGFFNADHPERMSQEDIVKQQEAHAKRETEEKEAETTKGRRAPFKKTREVKSKNLKATEEIPVTAEEIKAKQEELKKKEEVSEEIKEDLNKEVEKGVEEEVEKEEEKRVDAPPVEEKVEEDKEDE